MRFIKVWTMAKTELTAKQRAAASKREERAKERNEIAAKMVAAQKAKKAAQKAAAEKAARRQKESDGDDGGQSGPKNKNSKFCVDIITLLLENDWMYSPVRLVLYFSADDGSESDKDDQGRSERKTNGNERADKSVDSQDGPSITSTTRLDLLESRFDRLEKMLEDFIHKHVPTASVPPTVPATVAATVSTMTVEREDQILLMQKAKNAEDLRKNLYRYVKETTFRGVKFPFVYDKDAKEECLKAVKAEVVVLPQGVEDEVFADEFYPKVRERLRELRNNCQNSAVAKFKRKFLENTMTCCGMGCGMPTSCFLLLDETIGLKR